jgi:hypothetical protein
MTNPQLGQIFLGILVLLLGANLLGQLFRRLRQPKVVGEILAGILLGPTVIGKVAPGFATDLFGTDKADSRAVVLGFMYNLGLLMLVFVLGCAAKHLLGKQNARPPPGFGKIDVLVSNAADMPSPALAPYAATKAAIANFSASLAQLLGERGIRVNSVAPGPIWTPLIPSTMPTKKVANFGDDVPLGRTGQPAELAPTYVLLASDDGSYISGARIAVTGGRPIH